MSVIFKKDSAEKIAFKHNPKSIHVPTSTAAKDFVSLQQNQSSDFQIADIVAKQTGVNELRRKNIDAQVEEAVLDRLKEIEERAYKQAYDLGLIEGTERAFEEMREAYSERLQMLDLALQSIETAKVDVQKENEAILVNLVFQIAQKIAQREISLSHEPIVKMLAQLVSEVQGSDTIQVSLNPSDLQFIEELRQKNVKAAETLSRVKLLPNEQMQSGGCIIETNFGAIVSTVEQRTEKAWKLLEEKLPVVKRDVSS